MKISAEVKTDIIEKAEAYRYDYEAIGIRVQNKAFSLGEIEHVSHVWEDGEDTGEELDGICCISLNLLNRIACDYPGEHIAIIGGSLESYGEDEGEIIISEAEVLEVIC